MKSKKFRMLILLMCVFLCACGSTTTSSAKTPVEESSPLPPESSTESAEKPKPTEPEIYIIEGYSLEELGYSVTIPEVFEAITDPNHTDESANCFFKVRHSKQTEKLHAFVSFLNGGFTEIDINVAEDLAFNPYTMRLLQGYKLSELTGEKDRVRIGDDYLTAAQLEKYALLITDKIVICDFTNLYYSYAYSCDFSEATVIMGISDFDYSWLIPVYNDLGAKVNEMISYNQEAVEDGEWEVISQQDAEAIWISYNGFWNGPKNRFVHFRYDESGTPTLWWGLWDADGGRGYGDLIKVMKNSDGAIKAFIYYPEHPETEFMSHTPAETVQMIISNIGDGKLKIQYGDYDTFEFYKVGESFMEAYKAYSDLHHTP